MGNKKNTDVLYLVDDEVYLHLKKQPDGYKYAVYGKEGGEPQDEGMIFWEDMDDDHPTKLDCAVDIALYEIGRNEANTIRYE